jgi:hypothetical protein
MRPEQKHARESVENVPFVDGSCAEKEERGVEMSRSHEKSALPFRHTYGEHEHNVGMHGNSQQSPHHCQHIVAALQR